VQFLCVNGYNAMAFLQRVSDETWATCAAQEVVGMVNSSGRAVQQRQASPIAGKDDCYN